MNKHIKNILLLSTALFSWGSCSSDDTPIVAPAPISTPTLTDAELLENLQKDVLKYFWDYAEPTSKLAKERFHPDNPGLDAHIISTGGSGFGILTILTAVKNGHIPNSDALSRFATSLNFLGNAERFHGAWPHWINANTGKAIAFSPLDDGGDLVETAFMAQALICLREYYKSSTNPTEQALAIKADNLWKGIEWNWYTQNQNVLYWHWSPNFGFQINHQLRGFDETQIAYIMAAASPTSTITKTVYNEGWARNGNIQNSGTMFGIPLIANHNTAANSVGPLFWSHYSYLALDPRGLQDDYINYGNATTNHAKIMHQFSVDNPNHWIGYSTNNWGLTASYSRNSDGSIGYAAHQPSQDLGIISPTAALSSMPFTPVESMNYLKYLYNENKSKYIGIAGPYDAYSNHYQWVAPRYLALDQGTISPMIENHKTQFLWNLFMNAPDVRLGLIKLGFHSGQHGF